MYWGPGSLITVSSDMLHIILVGLVSCLAEPIMCYFGFGYMLFYRPL